MIIEIRTHVKCGMKEIGHMDYPHLKLFQQRELKAIIGVLPEEARNARNFDVR
jgi:hypothetical protein